MDKVIMADQFKKELKDELKSHSKSIMSSQEQKKKLFIYFIRTLIALAIIYYLWESVSWVKWAAIAYIPLNLFSLATITIMPHLLRKKLAKTEALIDSIGEEE